MAEEAFASGRCDAGQKLEALDAVADAARELAALPPVDRRADDEEDKNVLARARRSIAARPGREGTTIRAEKPRAPSRRNRSQRAASNPRALGGRRVGVPSPRAHRRDASPRRGGRRARHRAAERAAKKKKHPNDEDAAHVPGGGIDAIVLGRALGALGECCAAARNAPDAATLAGATLELVASHAVCDHPHPHVRRAAFFAAVGAVLATPAPAAWRAVRGGADGNGTGRRSGGCWRGRRSGPSVRAREIRTRGFGDSRRGARRGGGFATTRGGDSTPSGVPGGRARQGRSDVPPQNIRAFAIDGL